MLNIIEFIRNNADLSKETKKDLINFIKEEIITTFVESIRFGTQEITKLNNLKLIQYSYAPSNSRNLFLKFLNKAYNKEIIDKVEFDNITKFMLNQAELDLHEIILEVIDKIKDEDFEPATNIIKDEDIKPAEPAAVDIIRLNAWLLSKKRFDYNELCWFLAEKRAKCILGSPSKDTIEKIATEIFNQSLHYDVLCWFNAEMDFIADKDLEIYPLVQSKLTLQQALLV